MNKTMRSCITALIVLAGTVAGARTGTGTTVQEDAQHLEFQGIPVNGDARTFTTNMKDNGYRRMLTMKDMHIFTGDYAGMEKLLTVGFESEYTGQIFMVSVMLGKEKDWEKVQDEYNHMKNQLMKQYGFPADVQDSMPGDRVDDDSRKAYLEEQEVFGTTFRTELGSVLVTISSFRNGYQVTVNYIDRTNVELLGDHFDATMAHIKELQRKYS